MAVLSSVENFHFPDSDAAGSITDNYKKPIKIIKILETQIDYVSTVSINSEREIRNGRTNI